MTSLGDSSMADNVTIDWPGGQRQAMVNVQGNQVLRVTAPPTSERDRLDGA
jgi:hypothetical protein